VPGGTTYPSSVTDVEWALVRDLFERKGPGRPEQYTRRAMVDAIRYVVQSGCAWRMLPKDFPRWQVVYATFRRWSDDGLFEQMHDRMRRLWREREGRDDNPTASVLDSQSVRTAEKGGSTVSMRERKSTGASAIC
jgi:transposase